jgi:hypothetical protein
MAESDSKRREGAGRRLSLMPAYVIVLILTALAAVALARLAFDAFGAARDAGAISAPVRQELAFALIFNACAGAGLGIAALWEILASPIRLMRSAGLGRVLTRLVVAMLPLVVLGAGHALLNPELWELALGARSLLRG